MAAKKKSAAKGGSASRTGETLSVKLDGEPPQPSRGRDPNPETLEFQGGDVTLTWTVSGGRLSRPTTKKKGGKKKAGTKKGGKKKGAKKSKS